VGLLTDLFILVAADGLERVLKGYKRSPRKRGVATFEPARAGVSRLPAKVDLRSQMTPVEDQGGTNSCAANATAGAFEYLFKRHIGERRDASRLYIYYNGRYMADAENIEDEGVSLSDVIEGLKAYGACSEPTWRFDEDAVNDEPDGEAYEEGATFVIEGAKSVPTTLKAWKTALAAGNPIIFGVSLFDSFDKQRRPGVVPMPTAREAARGEHGGHAMLCVGYSDADEMFIVRNSWGKGWGDKGHCYMPYDYVMSEDYNFDDSWILTGVEELPADEEDGWSDDEDSVLPSAADALGEMDEETYAELLEACGEVPLAQRLGLLFLAAAGADGEVSDEEMEVIAGFLAPVLEITGGARSAKGVLKRASKHVDDEDVLVESKDIIWNYFEYDVLRRVIEQLREAAGADTLKRAEREFIDELYAYWEFPEE
jgi:C1A family cysteine protease